jgi:hypothetical protein
MDRPNRCVADTTPIRQVPPSGPGALAGYESRCSCGLVMRSSLLTIIRADVRDHLIWHDSLRKAS